MLLEGRTGHRGTPADGTERDRVGGGHQLLGSCSTVPKFPKHESYIQALLCLKGDILHVFEAG